MQFLFLLSCNPEDSAMPLPIVVRSGRIFTMTAHEPPPGRLSFMKVQFILLAECNQADEPLPFCPLGTKMGVGGG